NASAHSSESDRNARRQDELDPLEHLEAETFVQWLAWRGGHELQSPKARCLRCVGARMIESGREPAARPRRIDKERANACRIDRGIESRILRVLHLIAPEQCASCAPTTGGSQPLRSIDHEIGAVRDKLAIDPEDMVGRGLDLRRRIEADTQPASRPINES